MPLPFSKVFKKPGIRRILFPFTLALFLLLVAVFVTTGIN